MGISDHLTCLLRNMYVGQEATEHYMEQLTGSQLGKECDKAVYCHPVDLTYMQYVHMHAKSLQSCSTLCDAMDCSPPGSSFCPWDSPGKNNTGVGCHAFLQGIFLTQGSNSGPLHCRQIPYCLSHQGNPKESLAVLKSSQWRRSFKGKQKSQKPKETIQRFDYANIKKKKNLHGKYQHGQSHKNKWQTENKYLQHIPQRANLQHT